MVSGNCLRSALSYDNLFGHNYLYLWGINAYCEALTHPDLIQTLRTFLLVSDAEKGPRGWGKLRRADPSLRALQPELAMKGLPWQVADFWWGGPASVTMTNQGGPYQDLSLPGPRPGPSPVFLHVERRLSLSQKFLLQGWLGQAAGGLLWKIL